MPDKNGANRGRPRRIILTKDAQGVPNGVANDGGCTVIFSDEMTGESRILTAHPQVIVTRLKDGTIQSEGPQDLKFRVVFEEAVQSAKKEDA